ncbi:MAG: hypothetical protein K2N87_13635 [Eubacterium sp.]|nr:hypothetical protein [Eubacterium sp.]
MKEITLSKLERQLLLYDIFTGCLVTRLEDITARLPVQKKMIQRDISDLMDAGLICVVYSRKEQGYVENGQPVFREAAAGRRKSHLIRLNRLGRLMKELYNEDIPLWEKKDRKDIWGEQEEYVTAKSSYHELFPGLSERTRQRDFEVLTRIGYEIYFDNQDHCFVQQFCQEGLREDFGVRRKEGKLVRMTQE